MLRVKLIILLTISVLFSGWREIPSKTAISGKTGFVDNVFSYSEMDWQDSEASGSPFFSLKLKKQFFLWEDLRIDFWGDISRYFVVSDFQPIEGGFNLKCNFDRRAIYFSQSLKIGNKLRNYSDFDGGFWALNKSRICEYQKGATFLKFFDVIKNLDLSFWQNRYRFNAHFTEFDFDKTDVTADFSKFGIRLRYRFSLGKDCAQYANGFEKMSDSDFQQYYVSLRYRHKIKLGKATVSCSYLQRDYTSDFHFEDDPVHSERRNREYGLFLGWTMPFRGMNFSINYSNLQRFVDSPVAWVEEDKSFAKNKFWVAWEKKWDHFNL